MAGKRIFWTDEERNSLAKAMAEDAARRPGTKPMKLFRVAQKRVLAADRRRDINGESQIPKIMDKFRDLQTKTQPSDVNAYADRVHQGNQKEKTPIGEYGTEEIIIELVTRIASMVVPPIIKELKKEGVLTPQISKVSDTKIQRSRTNDKTTYRKRKVIVVGLKGDQSDNLDAEIRKALDLHFCAKDKPHELRNKAHKGDDVVLMSKFIKHVHQEIAKSVGARIMYCNGGLSELQDVLMDIATKGV